MSSLITDLPASYRADPIAHYAASRAKIVTKPTQDAPPIEAADSRRKDHDELYREHQEHLLATMEERCRLLRMKLKNEGIAIREYRSIAEIQQYIALEYGVSVVDIKSHRRSAEVVRPRQIAMYLCRVLSPRTLPEIARQFGGRDHTTVLHSVRKITALRKWDPELDARVASFQIYLDAKDPDPSRSALAQRGRG